MARQPASRTALLTAVLFFFLAHGTALAAVVQPDDMFFAPSSMVEAVYPIQSMTGGSTTPWVAVWVAADILAIDPGRVDITFTGIEVLPVLVANPALSSAEGEYTTLELAAINVTNYASSYLQQPGTDILDSNTDYIADLQTSQVTFTTTAPAVYAVRIETQSRPGVGMPLEAVDYLYSQFVDDFFGEDGARDNAGVSRKIQLEDVDCYVVSDNDPNDNGFNENAAETLMDQGKSVCRAASLAAAVTCVCDKSAQLGRKISVTFVGHGRPGSIKIGTERINNDNDGVDTPPEFQAKIDDCVNDVTFFSCNVAQGAAGITFLEEFADSITRGAGSWEDTVTAAKKSNISGKMRAGYFDVEAKTKKAKKGADVPALDREGFVLLFLAFLCVGALAALRLRQRHEP